MQKYHLDWNNIGDVKWPPARLVGPKVSTENALEFIRRTDSSFDYCMCNARQFSDDFDRLIGKVDGMPFAEELERRQAFSNQSPRLKAGAF